MKKGQKSSRKRPNPMKARLKEADRVFSLWIRSRDKRCICCGTTERLQCGHLITRGAKSVRFDEENSNAQCARCNFLHEHRPEFYTTQFLRKYGRKKYEDLVRRSKQPKKWTTWELDEIIQRYGG